MAPPNSETCDGVGLDDVLGPDPCAADINDLLRSLKDGQREILTDGGHTFIDVFGDLKPR